MNDALADDEARSRSVRGTVACSVAAWLAVVAIAAWSILSLQPGRVQAVDADPSRFSAGRALAHVRAIAAEPRPAGSRGHARAREYIVETLRGVGLAPTVEESEAISTRYGLPFDSATVANITARIEGPQGDGEILLVAHYDTVPTSPAAADDGSGVATLLETARALRAGPAPQSAVVFLFTDAEEIGAVGAERYAAETGAPRPDRVVLNFDARGTGGPCALVEAGPRSGALVRALASVDFVPTATSLAPVLARFHGLGTDFRPFREAGERGLNFAFVDGVAYYHTPRDDVAALDPRSLQQQGDIALAIVRAVGDPRTKAAECEGTFFPVPLWGLVWLPAGSEIAVALAATVLVFLLGVRARRSRPIRARNVAAACVALLLVAVAAAAAGQCVWWGVRAVDPVSAALRTADTFAPGAYRLSVVLASAAVAVVSARVAVRRIGVGAVAVAFAALLLVLTWLSVVWMPGIAYLFVVPSASIVLAFVPRERLGRRGWVRAAVVVALAVSVVLTWAPVPYFVLVALQLSAALGAGLAVAIPLVAVLLLFESTKLSLAWLSPIAAALAVVLFVYGVATARFDAAHPRPVSIAFAEDADTHRAFWIADRAGDDATSARLFADRVDPATLPPLFAESDTVVRASEARSAGVAGPEIALLGDTTGDGRRTVSFRLRSRRGAPWLFAFLDSDVRVLETTIDGSSASGPEITNPPPAGVRWGFRHIGLREEGIVWTIAVAASAEPLKIVVVDQTNGLPATAAGEASLPDDMMFARSWVSGTTLARTAASF